MKKLACLALLALSWNAFAGNLGDYATSANICGKFTTYQPSTGAAFALAGTPALSVYKDNSTTQSTTGVTLTASFDSVTGLNHYCIDTSADGTFYSAGSNFDVVITTGTVDSVSVVGSVVGSFSLNKVAALRPATAGRTLGVAADGDLIEVNTLTGHTAQTGDAFARLGAPAGASVSADILAVDNFVDDLESRLGTPSNLGGGATVAANLSDIEAQTDDIGTAGAGLTNIDLPNQTMDITGTITTVTNVTNMVTANTTQLSGDSGAADRLEAILDSTCGSYPELGITRGVGCTAQAYTAGTPSLTLDASAAFGDNTLEGATILICGSTQGYCQPAVAISNVGSTDVVTLREALPVAATGTITFTIFGTSTASGDVNVTTIEGTDATTVLGTAQTGDAYARLGAPAGASVSADIAAVKSDSAAILVDTGTTLDDFVDDLEARLGTPSNLGGGATVAANLADIEGQTDDIGAAGAGLTAADDAVMTRLGAPVGASLSADLQVIDTNVDDIETDTADMQPKLGTYSDLGSGATLAGNLEDMRDDGTATYSRTTDSLQAIRDRGDAAWTGAGGGDVTTIEGTDATDVIDARVLAQLTDIHLDHLLAADYDPASKPGVATALLNELIQSDGGVSQFTANALETAPSGSSITDWTADERTAMRAILGVPASGTTPDDPTTGIMDTIRDDTVDIQSRLPAALISGRMDSSTGAMAANVMTAAAAAGDLTTELQSGLATSSAVSSIDTKLGTPAGASMSADTAAVKSDTAAILVDTAEIGVAGAGLTAVDDAVLAAIEQTARADAAILNCEINTANFAGSTTTAACVLTDRDGGAVTVATGDLEGRELLVLSGTQAYEGRFITDTTWDAANSELRLTLSRALPGTLADAVTAIIR